VGKGYGWGEGLRVGKRVKGGKKGRRVEGGKRGKG
jgi:hypothetical protein